MRHFSTNKMRYTILALIVLIGIVFALLYFIDFKDMERKTLTMYLEQQDTMADMMMSSALKRARDNGETQILEEKLVEELENVFRTSQSSFGAVTVNGRIIFIKDDNTTSLIVDDKISSYFDENGVSSTDGNRYVISKEQQRVGTNDYQLLLCTKEKYIIGKINIAEMKIHCIGYFTLYAVAVCIVLEWLFVRNMSSEKKRKLLDAQLKSTHLTIEKLQTDKTNNYAQSEKEDSYPFYSKFAVEGVLEEMTEEEKKRCIQINIKVSEIKMNHFVQITSILGRIREGRSISCFWENDTFKVLLFDGDRQKAENFIQLFINKYKSDSMENVGGLEISASWLLES